MNIATKYKGEYGSNYRFTFTGITQEVADTLKTRATVWYDEEDNEIDIHCTNKSEISDIEIWFDCLVKEKPVDVVTTNNQAARRIELLSVAKLTNLNYGKSWVASAMNVDEYSLHPSWEGELICYVYS